MNEKLPLPPRRFATPARRFASDPADKQTSRLPGSVEGVAPVPVIPPVPPPSPLPPASSVSVAGDRPLPERPKRPVPAVTVAELRETIAKVHRRSVSGALAKSRRGKGLMLRMPKPLLDRLNKAVGVADNPQQFIRRLLDQHLPK